MRDMNETEAYLHARLVRLAQAHPTQAMFEEALLVLAKELGTAAGLLVGESKSADMRARFSGYYGAKLTDMRQGVKQDIRLIPDLAALPGTADDAETQSAPQAQASAPPAQPVTPARANINASIEAALAAARKTLAPKQLELVPDNTPEAAPPPMSPLFERRRREAGRFYLSPKELSVKRKALSLYQHEVAAKLELSQASISALELGERIGTLDEYMKLREILSLPVEEAHG